MGVNISGAPNWTVIVRALQFQNVSDNSKKKSNLSTGMELYFSKSNKYTTGYLLKNRRHLIIKKNV